MRRETQCIDGNVKLTSQCTQMPGSPTKYVHRQASRKHGERLQEGSTAHGDCVPNIDTLVVHRVDELLRMPHHQPVPFVTEGEQVSKTSGRRKQNELGNWEKAKQ